MVQRGEARGPRRPFVVGVAGGSGSGKTTIAKTLAERLGPDAVVVIEQDSYYRDLAHIGYDERTKVNFDHPDAIDFDLLVTQLDELCSGGDVDKPQYDFAQHVRAATSDRVEPRPVIIVEGILVLTDARLRERFDLNIFVDTAADLRVMRRIRRDLEQRGRTFAQIRRQYYDTVRPMHLAFVEPSKEHADVIIPEGGRNRVALELILGRTRELVRQWRAADGDHASGVVAVP